MRKALTNSKNNNLIRHLDLIILVLMVNQMSNQLTLHAMKCQAQSVKGLRENIQEVLCR